MFIYILVYMIFQYVFSTHICLAAQKEDILTETKYIYDDQGVQNLKRLFYNFFCNLSKILEIC